MPFYVNQEQYALSDWMPSWPALEEYACQSSKLDLYQADNDKLPLLFLFSQGGLLSKRAAGLVTHANRLRMYHLWIPVPMLWPYASGQWSDFLAALSLA